MLDIASTPQNRSRQPDAAGVRDESGESGKPGVSALKGGLDKLGKPCRCPEAEGDGSSDPAEPEGLATMRKRARSRWITSELLDQLEELDSPVPYDRSRSCCSTVLQEDGALTSSYCRCRWCIVCNRIRMGTMVNRYAPIMALWEREGGVFHVTLTVPNVRAGKLGETIDTMKTRLRYCRRSIRETRGLDYRVLENWEVTYNPERDDFHPHVHCLVRGKVQALALREEWLKRWESASPAAQDVSKWDGSTSGLVEAMKYATKMIAPDCDEEGGPPAEALDTIFRVLYRKNLCNPAGFDVKDERARALDSGITLEEASRDLDEEEDGDEIDDLEACVRAFRDPGRGRVWSWEGCDWWCEDTGEALTGYDPTEDDRRAVSRE